MAKSLAEAPAPPVEVRRAASKARYEASHKGRAAAARYEASEKGRARSVRYNRSSKGKLRAIRYNSTTRGRARTMRFEATPKRRKADRERHQVRRERAVRQEILNLATGRTR